MLRAPSFNCQYPSQMHCIVHQMYAEMERYLPCIFYKSKVPQIFKLSYCLASTPSHLIWVQKLHESNWMALLFF